MATDYATLKKGGWMRQKQKNNFSLRVRVVGGNLTATQLAKIAEVADKYGEGYAHLTADRRKAPWGTCPDSLYPYPHSLAGIPLLPLRNLWEA